MINPIGAYADHSPWWEVYVADLNTSGWDHPRNLSRESLGEPETFFGYSCLNLLKRISKGQNNFGVRSLPGTVTALYLLMTCSGRRNVPSILSTLVEVLFLFLDCLKHRILLA